MSQVSVPRHFELTTQQYANTAVVRLAGEFDIACEEHFEEAMRALEQTAGSIVVDLTRLTFIDSTGLRLLLAAHEGCKEHSVRLVVVPGDGAVKRTLELTGLHRVLSLADSQSPFDLAQAVTEQDVLPAA